MTNEISNEGAEVKLTMASVPETPRAANLVFDRAAARQRINFAPLWRHLGSLVLILVLSAGCYAVISRFLLETVRVVGVSMTPTLQENGQYFLNRWAFHDRSPQHSDIVVIRDPADHGYSVKRIIATSGESVLFKEGKVYVDGKQLAEPYLAPNTHTYTYAQAKEQLINCGKDQYFLLGDNRLRSIDSRSYGPVPRENILGLVIIR